MGIASCWGIAGMAKKVSRDRGNRSDAIAISRDTRPLRRTENDFLAKKS